MILFVIVNACEEFWVIEESVGVGYWLKKKCWWKKKMICCVEMIRWKKDFVDLFSELNWVFCLVELFEVCKVKCEKDVFLIDIWFEYWMKVRWKRSIGEIMC